MVLDEIFERFVQQSPVTVMVRATLEHALAPQVIDALFERTAERRYTRTLPCSSVVDLMAAVVTKVQPAVNTEPGVSAELVWHTAGTLGPVIAAMSGERAAWLPGYRVKILDGNHLAGTEHRLKKLRTTRAGALPGKALVVLDPQAMLVGDVFCCEDGSDRSWERCWVPYAPVISGSPTATSARPTSSSGSPGVRVPS